MLRLPDDSKYDNLTCHVQTFRGQPLTENEQFPQQDRGQISLSRCSNESSNAGFLLAPATSGEENVCTLSTSHNLEMWLSLQKQPCPDQLLHSFQDDLIRKVITAVNGLRRCGLSRLMLNDMLVSKSCISKDETRVDVKFTVKAALSSQLPLVVQGYETFVRDPNHNLLHLKDGDYLLHNCSKLCSAPMVKPTSDSEKKTQVTVGVVLACVGVFIMVLLVVIMYMKKKRRGILQFRMTRLDEEDDDIIGDMDDFVGNQGPTFRSFR
ncbi:hypothetical protein PoB_004378600 [Plakobranchus ocellatus]|uniref:Uncharacterized protein n=1 Tax=Plakobranchus ocellatus TaxID=259542 RepID=A0AAV4BER0_9GAST|nr:hypothetical protein PoB_004378600 [Plakobranchus ocellatus]